MKYECRSAWPSEEPSKKLWKKQCGNKLWVRLLQKRHHYYSMRYKNRSQQCYDSRGKMNVLECNLTNIYKIITIKLWKLTNFVTNDVSNLFCKTKSHKNIVTWTQKQSTWNTYILFKILALELDWLIELNYNDNKIDFVQSIQKTKKFIRVLSIHFLGITYGMRNTFRYI